MHVRLGFMGDQSLLLLLLRRCLWKLQIGCLLAGLFIARSGFQYYINPISGLRFRSKKAVLLFLENGTKRIQGKHDSDKDTPSGERSKNQKSAEKAKSVPKILTLKNKEEKEHALTRYDFGEIPDSVTWVLRDASQRVWTPFVGGQKAHESSRKDWATLTLELLYNL